MNGLRIEIELSQSQAARRTRAREHAYGLQSSVWQPGETLHGHFHVANCSGRKLRAAECSVLWYTVGKGDEDVHVHSLLRFELEDDRANSSTCTRSFSFDLPTSPQAYDGVIVKIRWCVRVRVFLSAGLEVVSETPFTLGRTQSARLAEPISELAL